MSGVSKDGGSGGISKGESGVIEGEDGDSICEIKDNGKSSDSEVKCVESKRVAVARANAIEPGSEGESKRARQ